MKSLRVIFNSLIQFAAPSIKRDMQRLDSLTQSYCVRFPPRSYHSQLVKPSFTSGSLSLAPAQTWKPLGEWKSKMPSNLKPKRGDGQFSPDSVPTVGPIALRCNWKGTGRAADAAASVPCVSCLPSTSTSWQHRNRSASISSGKQSWGLSQSRLWLTEATVAPAQSGTMHSPNPESSHQRLLGGGWYLTLGQPWT